MNQNVSVHKSVLLLFLTIVFYFTACDNGNGGDEDADVDVVQDPDAIEEVSPEIDVEPEADVEADVPEEEVPGESITFTVLTASDTGEFDQPLEGATVAFDAPGGVRTEEVTGTGGAATFEGIDWSAGAAAVTAHMEGYSMISIVNLTEARAAEMEEAWGDGTMHLAISNLDPEYPEPVWVSGTATGFVDTAQNYVVNVANAPLGPDYSSEWIGRSDLTFSITVPSGEAFTLQGLEVVQETVPSGQGYIQNIYRVMNRDFDAITEDLSGVELDFAADEVSTYTADTSIALPDRADSPLREGYPVCLICNSNSGYCNGWATHVDISTDGNRFDASFLWTQPSWAEGVYTDCRAFEGSFLRAYSSRDGYPDGSALDPFLDVPEWVIPEDPRDAVPMDTTLEWQLFDSGVHTQLYVVHDGKWTWKVFAGMDATSLTLTDPPSSVDMDSFFGTHDISAAMYAYVVDETSKVIYLWSTSEPILISH